MTKRIINKNNKTEFVFKCYSNISVSNIVICIICDNVYHEGDYNKYKKDLYVSKFLVVCPEHLDQDLT